MTVTAIQGVSSSSTLTDSDKPAAVWTRPGPGIPPVFCRGFRFPAEHEAEKKHSGPWTGLGGALGHRLHGHTSEPRNAWKLQRDERLSPLVHSLGRESRSRRLSAYHPDSILTSRSRPLPASPSRHRFVYWRTSPGKSPPFVRAPTTALDTASVRYIAQKNSSPPRNLPHLLAAATRRTFLLESTRSNLGTGARA